jgi:hypothetical protein
VFERDLDGESGYVGLGQIAGAGPGVDTLRGELAHPLSDTDRVLIARHDLGSGAAEGQCHGVPDLTGTSHSGD